MMPTIPLREFGMGFTVAMDAIIRESTQDSLGDWHFIESPHVDAAEHAVEHCATEITWAHDRPFLRVRCRCDERAQVEAARRYWGDLLALPDEAWGEPIIEEID